MLAGVAPSGLRTMALAGACQMAVADRPIAETQYGEMSHGPSEGRLQIPPQSSDSLTGARSSAGQGRAPKRDRAPAPRGRRRVLAALGAALVLALVAVTLTSKGARWRLKVIGMKAGGDVPELGWGELLWSLRPGSPIYLGNLPVIRTLDFAVENPYSSPGDSIEGAAVFRNECSSCHGFDGRPGESAPNLSAVATVAEKSDWGLYTTISHGIPGTGMRAHPLPPRTIWRLVAYIRRLRAGAGEPVVRTTVDVPFFKAAQCWFRFRGLEHVTRATASRIDSAGWHRSMRATCIGFT